MLAILASVNKIIFFALFIAKLPLKVNNCGHDWLLNVTLDIFPCRLNTICPKVCNISYFVIVVGQ